MGKVMYVLAALFGLAAALMWFLSTSTKIPVLVDSENHWAAGLTVAAAACGVLGLFSKK